MVDFLTPSIPHRSIIIQVKLPFLIFCLKCFWSIPDNQKDMFYYYAKVCYLAIYFCWVWIQKNKTNSIILVSCHYSLLNLISFTLCEKCPNMEFFLVRIFPHSDWIRRDTSYLSVFSPSAEKYRPAKTPYLVTFHAVLDNHLRLKWISLISN